jgi:hypothetical protein
MDFNGSNSPAYRTRPANASNYAWRDAAAPSANVKTLAKANARLDRYLEDAVPEDDRITCTVKLPASKVTGIKAGQRVQAKFSHLPNGSNSTWGSAFKWCRVLNRSVMANEQTNALYNVRYELSPISSLTCPALAPFGPSPAATDVLGGNITTVTGPPYYAPPFNPTPSGPPGYSYVPPGSPPSAVSTWISGVDYAGTPLVLYGTPDNGSNFGVGAGVTNGPQLIQMGWTFDLGSPASICLFVFGGLGEVQQGYASGVVALDASDDGITWTSMATPADVLTHIVPASYSGIAAIPTASSTAFRYWRLLFLVNDTATGLHYFRGYDFTFVSLYKAELA